MDAWEVKGNWMRMLQWQADRLSAMTGSSTMEGNDISLSKYAGTTVSLSKWEGRNLISMFVPCLLHPRHPQRCPWTRLSVARILQSDLALVYPLPLILIRIQGPWLCTHMRMLCWFLSHFRSPSTPSSWGKCNSLWTSWLADNYTGGQLWKG